MNTGADFKCQSSGGFYYDYTDKTKLDLLSGESECRDKGAERILYDLCISQRQEDKTEKWKEMILNEEIKTKDCNLGAVNRSPTRKERE